eukprot:GHVR01039559.1.p1 GENE.GHVR01039559.1~~GHVR01039559.1.p1  ORF type:complete len:961 (+),score=164.26 GHVR01039559.1:54-2936(+)
MKIVAVLLAATTYGIIRHNKGNQLEVQQPHQGVPHFKRATMQEVKEMASTLSPAEAIHAVGEANFPPKIKQFLQGDLSVEDMDKYDPSKVIEKLNSIFEDSQVQMDLTFVECKNAVDDIRTEMKRLASDRSESSADLAEDEAELSGWVAAKERTEQTVQDLEEQKKKEADDCARSFTESITLIKMITHDLTVVENVIETNKCNAKNPNVPNVANATSQVTDDQLQAAADSAANAAAVPPVASPSAAAPPAAAAPAQAPAAPAFIQMDEATTATVKARQMLAAFEQLNAIGNSGGSDTNTPYYELTQEQKSYMRLHDKQELVRCTYPDGLSYLSFESPEVARAMVQLTNKRFHSLQKKLESLIQMSSHHTNGTLPDPGNKMFDTAQQQMENARSLAKKIRNDQLEGQSVRDVTESSCSFAGSALCPEFYEKLGGLQADVSDELQEENNAFARTRKMCEERSKQFTQDINSWNVYLGKVNERIPRVQARIDSLIETVKSLQELYMSKLAEHDAKFDTCETKMGQYKSEMCGCVKVKTELMRMNGVPNEIWDCEVTAFQEGKCTADCEGGVKEWSRQVLMKNTPVYGTKCPALKLETSCNEMPCPIDCIEDKWTPWTRCSKECGIGEAFRVREIEVEPRHGGVACGPRQEEQLCDMGECETPCVLNGWSMWGQCTAFCGGGVKTRKRTVQRSATGGGFCAPAKDPSRWESAECNMHTCSPGTASCSAKQDVMVVLDSSGSIGRENWDKVVAAAKNYIDRLQFPDSKVGIIVFSYNVRTILKMTSSNSFVQRRLSTLGNAWMGSSTSTDWALTKARIELQQGGRGTDPSVSQTVLVITDGVPWRMRDFGVTEHARDAAETIVNAGINLVWVPIMDGVGSDFFRDVGRFDNTQVLPFQEIDELVGDEGINVLISKTCANVSFGANMAISDNQTGTVIKTSSTQTPAPANATAAAAPPPAAAPAAF